MCQLSITVDAKLYRTTYYAFKFYQTYLKLVVINYSLVYYFLCKLQKKILKSKTRMTTSSEAQLSFIKSFKINNPPPTPGYFTPVTIKDGFRILNTRCQNCKKLQSESTNNRDMLGQNLIKYSVVCEYMASH